MTEQTKHRLRAWAIAIAVLGIIGFIFHDPILHWFVPGHERGGEAESTTPALPGDTVDQIRVALGAYEQIRALLAADSIDGLSVHAGELSRSLRAAREYGGGDEVDAALDSAIAASDRLGYAGTVEEARTELAALSESLIPLIGRDHRLREGLHLFSCPMTSGYGLWVQSEEDLENPYMGSAMLTCGSSEPWPEIRERASRTSSSLGISGSDVAYWTCPMHPSVKQQTEGDCPICGMDLLPVSHADVESGALLVDEGTRRRIGVRLAAAIVKPVTLEVRAVGRTTWDETKLEDVTLRVEGWVERLYVNETGQAIRRGQTMLSVYSPQLYSAQQEYLLAIRSRESARGTSAPERAGYLVRSAAARLRLLGLSDGQIGQIEQRGAPLENMPILSPVSGFVVEKDVVEGSSVKAGQRLFRVAALDTIWVEADVYEKDLGAVTVGQTAMVSFPYLPGESRTGRVTWIYPFLDPATRTGKIRVELRNPDLSLRPEMYANVQIVVDRGSKLVVPESAVVQTGPRSLVFVDLGNGRLEPRRVETGARAGTEVEIVSGLSEGEHVVTSANFLISSESRIRSAERILEGEEE